MKMFFFYFVTRFVLFKSWSLKGFSHKLDWVGVFVCLFFCFLFFKYFVVFCIFMYVNSLNAEYKSNINTFYMLFIQTKKHEQTKQNRC